jgi:DNA-binding HxlR family transcriptional regulator
MKIEDHNECLKARKGIEDFLEVTNGKWKLFILISLFEKPYRFKELAKEINISPRMLSRELKDLEINKLISRIVYDTKPITVEYSITKAGLSLKKVIFEMAGWGISYRKKMVAKEN